MKKVEIVEKEVVAVPVEAKGESTASNAIWAITFIIILGLIAGAVYYSGILKKAPAGGQKVDVDISVPSR